MLQLLTYEQAVFVELLLWCCIVGFADVIVITLLILTDEYLLLPFAVAVPAEEPLI